MKALRSSPFSALVFASALQVVIFCCCAALPSAGAPALALRAGAHESLALFARQVLGFGIGVAGFHLPLLGCGFSRESCASSQCNAQARMDASLIMLKSFAHVSKRVRARSGRPRAHCALLNVTIQLAVRAVANKCNIAPPCCNTLTHAV